MQLFFDRIYSKTIFLYSQKAGSAWIFQKNLLNSFLRVLSEHVNTCSLSRINLLIIRENREIIIHYRQVLILPEELVAACLNTGEIPACHADL